MSLYVILPLKLVWQEMDLFYVAQQEELIIKSYIQDTTFIEN